MSTTEFKKAISRCGFLLDWQKEKLAGMLDGVEDMDYEHNGHIHADDIFPIMDNVLWRTMGTGMDSMSVDDQLSIEFAIREAVS